MNYTKMGYGMIEKTIANCDKASAYGDSKVIRSPWGTFTMYNRSSITGHRYYSLRGSTVFANRGSLLISTIKKMLRSLVK